MVDGCRGRGGVGVGAGEGDRWVGGSSDALDSASELVGDCDGEGECEGDGDGVGEGEGEGEGVGDGEGDGEGGRRSRRSSTRCTRVTRTPPQRERPSHPSHSLEDSRRRLFTKLKAENLKNFCFSLDIVCSGGRRACAGPLPSDGSSSDSIRRQPPRGLRPLPLLPIVDL